MSEYTDSESEEHMDTEEHTVASMKEIREVVREADRVNLDFFLAPDTALAAAQMMWEYVNMGLGGNGTIRNPDLLCNKEEALLFFHSKRGQLEKWKSELVEKAGLLKKEIDELKLLIEQGGPGVLSGHESRCYSQSSIHLDLDQEEPEDDEQHKSELMALILQESPVSPKEDGYWSVESCQAWESQEQLDAARMNVLYLQIKQEIADFATSCLEQGLKDLEIEFLYKRSYPGAGAAEYPHFKDVVMSPAELKGRNI